METRISSKLAAFVAALMMSSLIRGGVAYLPSSSTRLRALM